MKKSFFWLYALSSAVYFTQGIEGLPAQGLFYYLKETLNFSAEKIMVIGSITTAAWLVKPFIGYVIDRFLDKRRWIIISLCADGAFALLLGLVSLPIGLLVAALIVKSADAALRDVAVDGVMCVEGKRHAITGKIQSVQWIAITVAGLFTGIGGGIIAEKWGYRAGFLWLIPVYAAVFFTSHFYHEHEERDEQPSGPRVMLRDVATLLRDKKLMIVGLFIFLYRYSPSFGTPLFFIERDVFKWGKVWIGTLGTISTLFSVAGALLYYRMSKRIRMFKWLWWSVFLGAATTLSYLYYTPATAVLYDIVYSLLGMFIFLLVLDFMAQKTVKGLEATSFALLTSISNLSLVASNLSGAYLLPRLGLPVLIVISALTSFLCLPLIRRME